MLDAPKTDPQLRPMTRLERRGFDYALDVLTQWANEIEAAMVSVPATGIKIPLEEQQANSARMTRSLAVALKREPHRTP